MSAVSSTVLTDPSPAPLVAMDTSGLSRITIGETTPQMQPLNLPQLRQMPAPAPEHPLRAKLHDRKASLEVPRPHELVLRLLCWNNQFNFANYLKNTLKIV